MNRVQRWQRVIATVLLCAGSAVQLAGAQTRKVDSSASNRAIVTLDYWIVRHYKGEQLLQEPVRDSMTARDSSAAPARVEHILDARGDSVAGVHFSSAPRPAGFDVRAGVRLVVPSGAITNLTGQVVARRHFRAPRTPGADSSIPSAWRHGWAYLVVLPRDRDGLAANATRGWLLLPTPTNAKKTGER